VVSPNYELEALYTVAWDAIRSCLHLLKPGNTVSQIVDALDTYISKSGFVPGPPYGHLCSVDLIDARVSHQNKSPLTTNTAMIIHPTVFTPDRKYSFFWGETYLITDNGYERLNHASDALITIS